MPGMTAVQVLQRPGVADPVMGLHLGHRDDQIGLDDLLREVEPVQAAGAAAVVDPADLAVVQIGEVQPRVVERLLHARLDQRHFGVAHVARSFAHDHASSPAAKDFGRRHDHGRMRRHLRAIGASARPGSA